MSLAYSLVPLMFQVPFDHPHASPVEAVTHANAYGRGYLPCFLDDQLHWHGCTWVSLVKTVPCSSDNHGLRFGLFSG